MYVPLEFYQFIAQNKSIFRVLYSVIIAFICLIIVLKTDKLFRISSHQGIRYFRNAFFFYGIAFLLRALLISPIYSSLTKMAFEFFMIMAGFFLFYSLLWKRLETKKDTSSLLNPKIIMLYALTLILIVLDYLWGGYNFMFISQIILFLLASVISYNNYQTKGKEHKFLKLYFGVMVLNFVAWLANFIFANFLGGRLRWLANIYILNVIIFLIFLYGVNKFTKKKKVIDKEDK
jgi:hypothetical protein